MIDGGITVVTMNGYEMCLYEAMRELAGQFSRGGMSIECFLDSLEYLALSADKKEVIDGNACNW